MKNLMLPGVLAAVLATGCRQASQSGGCTDCSQYWAGYYRGSAWTSEARTDKDAHKVQMQLVPLAPQRLQVHCRIREIRFSVQINVRDSRVINATGAEGDASYVLDLRRYAKEVEGTVVRKVADSVTHTWTIRLSDTTWRVRD